MGTFPQVFEILNLQRAWEIKKKKQQSYQGNICLLWSCLPKVHRELEHRNCHSGFGGKEGKYIQGED